MELVEQLLQEKVRSFLDIGVKPAGNDPSQFQGIKVGREIHLDSELFTRFLVNISLSGHSRHTQELKRW